MEPSGLMDSVHSCKDELDYSRHCDIADEEVHFSRIAHTFHQYQAPYQSHQHQISSAEYQKLPGSGPSSLQDATLYTNVSLAQPAVNPLSGHSMEQAKSHRLLTSISSKLRRGSNYLVAPKLLGQYLLGITIQSWSQFFSTSRMMKAPSTTHIWTRRVLENLTHFQGNYLCVSLVLIIYCILTSPFLLLAILAYLAALYLVTARSATGRHFMIAGYRPNLQQQYSFITLTSLPLLWVAGAPSAVFWVIGASFVVVGLHASMYNPIQSVGSCSINANMQIRAPNSGRTVANSVQYYNHHPETQLYQPLPSASLTCNSLPVNSNGPSSLTNASSGPQTGHLNKYTSALSHWIASVGHTKQGKPVSHISGQAAASRVPDVTIISQDYAGLGRVYEI